MSVRVVVLVACLPLAVAQMLVTVPSLGKGNRLPQKFGCDVDQPQAFWLRPSPVIAWHRAPSRARSLVLLMDGLEDEDNENATQVPKIHWLAKDIPVDGPNGQLDEDATLTNMPMGSRELTNSFNTQGYAAPCVPDSTKTYRVRLFAFATATVALPDSDSPDLAAVEATLQAANPLYVAVRTFTMKFPAPSEINAAIFSAPFKSFVNVSPFGRVVISAAVQPMCEWKVLYQESGIVKLIATMQQRMFGKSFTVFTFASLGVSTVSRIVLGLVCDFGQESKPIDSLANVHAVQVTHNSTGLNTTTVVIDDNVTIPASNRTQTRRYVKPSEVVGGTRVPAPSVPCGSKLRGDCYPDADAQGLMAVSSKTAGDCTRKSRTENGAVCPLSVRVADLGCDRAHLLPTAFGTTSSLPVTWTDIPKGTESLAVVVEESGTVLHPSQSGPVLWFVADIEPATVQLAANASGSALMPGLSMEYPTSSGAVGYEPPCTAVPNAHSNDQSKRLLRVWVFALRHRRARVSYWLHLHHSNAKRDDGTAPTPTPARQLLAELSRDAVCSSSVEVAFSCDPAVFVATSTPSVASLAAQDAEAVPGESV